MTESTPAFEQQRAMCEVSEPFDFGIRKNSSPDIELRRIDTADDGSHPCCRSDPIRSDPIRSDPIRRRGHLAMPGCDEVSSHTAPRTNALTRLSEALSKQQTASGEPHPASAYVALSDAAAVRRYGAPRTKPTTQMTLSTRICACDFPKSSRACAARRNVSASVSLMIHCRPFFCHCARGQISRRRSTSIGFQANRTDVTPLPPSRVSCLGIVQRP
jgi:hypothetical protein